MIKIAEAEKKLNNYKFTDLFVRIGGFHYALKSLGSEIDEKESYVYELNYGLKSFGYITKIK